MQAIYLGKTGEDFIQDGPTQAANNGIPAPDGIQDEHIQVTGVPALPSAIEIKDNNSIGTWEYPFDGNHSSIYPIFNAGTLDLFFDGWMPSTSWHVKLTIGGVVTEMDTGAAPAPPVPPDGINDPDLTLPPNDGNADNLKSAMIFNTAPYEADGIVHTIDWINPGADIYVKKAYLWTGIDKDGVCDSVVNMRRISDNSYLARLQWDHYANPTTPRHDVTEDFDAKYMKIASGDGIRMKYLSQWGVSPPHAQHLGIIWFHY